MFVRIVQYAAGCSELESRSFWKRLLKDKRTPRRTSLMPNEEGDRLVETIELSVHLHVGDAAPAGPEKY